MKTKQPLFKKIACFTDIHFGKSHDSRIHNQDCTDFIDWFCSEAKKRNCDKGAFLGDWHHSRNSINVSTLNYTHDNLATLNDSFEKFYLITGNHDLFFREKRDLHSMPMGKLYPNIKVIEAPYTDGNVTFYPWLVDNEWKQVEKNKSKYIFGHFELPGFKMNAMIDMPDNGGLTKDYFKNQDYVFSGHFHKRQIKGKVHYIGNPFGHNYADVWDFERGAMFLEWDGIPEYVNYEGPKYISLNLSDLTDAPDQYLSEKVYANVILDVPITYEEATFLKDTLVEAYKLRELKLSPKKEEGQEGTDDVQLKFESVDQIVLEQLNSIDSTTYKKEKLIEIYNNLHD